MLSRAFVLLLAMLFMSVLSSPVLGAGFALQQQGTAAMAQGNAFVAQADDPTAIFYNPAGLNQLKRAEVYLGTVFNHPDREFHPAAGPVADTNHRWYHVPTIYAAIPFNDRVAAGVGVFSPFGLGTAWSPTWVGRYLTTASTLQTFNLNPAVSVKALENLSLAAGLDVLWSSVRLKRKIPIFLPTPNGLVQLPDGESNMGGSGMGWGYNLGALYECIPGVKFGVSYRSEISVNHSGDLALSVPQAIPAPFRPPARVGGDSDLTFPPSVTFGVAYSRLKPFTFEFDATWTGWSTYDQLQLNFQQKVPVAGKLASSALQPKNWHDAWAFRFGANYEVKPGMKLRAGYIYDLTPVPDDTFDPQVPDSNRHIFTAGGDIKIKRLTLGLAYNFVLQENRTKNNIIALNGAPLASPAFQANGRYQGHSHSVGLSTSFRF